MKSFLIALQFLTRLNVKSIVEINEDNFGRSGLYFPLVGLIIGSILALVFFAVNQVFQPLSTIIIVLALEVFLSGGLHLDGLMDSCDGIFSGRERERILEIMKDSRVGSMGVLGLLALIGLKIAFLLEIPAKEIIQVIMIMPLLGRLAMIWVIIRFPYARENGLGGLFRQGTGGISLYFVAAYALILCIIILPYKMLFTIVLTMASSHYVSCKISRLLRGHTGDTYGAISELTELFFVFWYAVGIYIINKLPLG